MHRHFPWSRRTLLLVTNPHKPKRRPVINIRLADERYRSRKPFLNSAYWSVELK